MNAYDSVARAGAAWPSRDGYSGGFDNVQQRLRTTTRSQQGRRAPYRCAPTLTALVPARSRPPPRRLRPAAAARLGARLGPVLLHGLRRAVGIGGARRRGLGTRLLVLAPRAGRSQLRLQRRPRGQRLGAEREAARVGKEDVVERLQVGRACGVQQLLEARALLRVPSVQLLLPLCIGGRGQLRPCSPPQAPPSVLVPRGRGAAW